MGIRRNSPSFSQATKVRIPLLPTDQNVARLTSPQKQAFTGDSSPFDASPSSNSPIHFWKGRQSVSPSRMGASENSPNFSASSEKRRVSIEKLQKASRVKNSTMFARENSQIYDPEASSFIERPLASGRPLSLQQQQGNASGGKGFESAGGKTSPSRHRRGESNHSIDFRSPTKAPTGVDNAESQPQSQGSPQKSSLSNNHRFGKNTKFDPEAGTWSDDEATATIRPGQSPLSSGRNPKTVSFDAAPPQVNEYEMITPDPSSAASGSREGSYESDCFDMDAQFDDLVPAEGEDSFDDSLEDANNTPVVLPEDWRFMSPEVANTDLADTFEDPFEEGSPDSHSKRRNSLQTRQFLLSRNDSVNSDGERRPLPPLPGIFTGTSHERQASDSQAGPGKLNMNPHVSGATHPRPASLSKTDILEMKSSSAMPLEERLRLLAVQEGEKNSHSPEPQRPDELGGHDFQNSGEEVNARHSQSPDSGSQTEGPPEIEVKRHAPKISRESILRKMKSQHFTDSDGDSSIPSSPVHEKIFEEYANLDPDVAIPSREPSSNYDEDQMNAEIKREEDDNQHSLDLYSYPELKGFEDYAPSETDDAGRESSVVRHSIPDDDVSSLLDEDVGPDDENVQISGIDDGAGSDECHDDTTVQALDPPLLAPLNHERQQKEDPEDQKRMSLPEFPAFGENDDFNLSLKSYMTPSPPVVEDIKSDQSKQSDGRKSDDVASPSNEREIQHDELLSEPVSNKPPEASNESLPLSPPPLDTGLPESEPHEVPGRVATVKAHGSKLKVRRSATTAELEGLNEAAQYTCDEKPPSIPERFRVQGAESKMEDRSETNSIQESERLDTDANHEGLSMTLELNDFNNDDGLGLDQEFDRLLEAQKVKDIFPIPTRAVLPLPLKYSNNADYIPGQGFLYQNAEANPYITRQRGYLMRQNTKVVVAKRNVSTETKSSDGSRNVSAQIARPRETKSAGNSPRKASTAYTKEPWNGKQRRQSTRRSNMSPEKGLPAPPMPQKATEEAQMGGLTEDSATMAEEMGAGIDRGRFFVKVCAVKDLDIPLPRSKSNVLLQSFPDLSDSCCRRTQLVPAYSGQRTSLRDNSLA